MQEIAGEVLLRARRRLAGVYYRVTDHTDKGYVSDADLTESLAGQQVADVARRIRERKQLRLTVGLADLAGTVETIKQFFPEAVEQTIREAEAILSHRITIFDRVFDFGASIDWHRDPATRVRWPLEHFTRTQIKRGGGSDVRVVWELNRFHHLTTLGRAYALTGDERYTEEFLLQIVSWHEQNPPRFGVNWTVAMEAAIRAINLIAAIDLFRASPLLTDEAIELMLKTLIAHGRFIRANLEFSYRAPSNHYLSDLIGLFVIAMMMPELAEASSWASYSAPRLLEQMDRQILTDGVDYEGSTGYHRLALEIFTTFFALSQAASIELASEHWERLEAMFDFARHYLKPDGTAPLIGDSDDGRLLKFSERTAVDHSYLMSIAAALLENEAFKQSSRIDVEAVWWFGNQGLEAFDGLPINENPPESRAFPEAQIFIQRAIIRHAIDNKPIQESITSEDAISSQANETASSLEATPEKPSATAAPEDSFYAIIDCGDHGARGRGSHAHSDALSIELFAFDRTFLRDPGTFVYTANGRWRNRFRSTAYHNTVRIDGQEISRIADDQLFSLGPNVRPRVNLCENTPERDTLDAEHFGYATLPAPVEHRRIITFDKREAYWVIEDIFEGQGEHRFDFFFNFDTGIEVVIEDDHRALAHDGRSALAIIPVSGHAFETGVVTRWVSLSYGTRSRSSGIIYRLHKRAPFESVIMIVPYRLGDESKVKRVVGMGAGSREPEAGSQATGAGKDEIQFGDK